MIDVDPKKAVNKSRSKKKPVEAAPTIPSTFPPREEHPPRPGDVVMLPDGTLAAIEKIVGSDAHVIEWTKQIGRGPWIFPISDLVPVS